MLRSYIRRISEIAGRGDAREESFYSTLEGFLSEFAQSTGRKDSHVTTLPKKTEAGNPDFRIWDGKQRITGYIEAKAPSFEDLDKPEQSEQLRRYRNTFPNLILTNFFEFRLYREGVRIDRILAARPFVARSLKAIPPIENEKGLFELLEKFFSFSLPKVRDAKSLATELAKRTRFLKDEIIALELRNEATGGKGFIHGFYEAFKEYLIAGLSEDEFADLYSQTITYGLFAARTRSKDGFNRRLAYHHIPRTVGILRDVFRFISLEDIPKQMEWIIDDISEVLSVADANKLLHDFFHEGKGKDPIVHFYETFLAEYDPKTREKRGVYYTPEPVVSYIVRSIHQILKDRFSRPDGLASAAVTALDPAAGTLTFLAEAAKVAVEEFVDKYGEGGKADFIREYILENFYAFELMMAPYAVGHLKMAFLLEELGYSLQDEDRFKLYLTNTLEMEDLVQTSLPGMAALSEESHFAGRIKKEQPILVILGNPPYSGHSANKGKWITDLLKKGYRSHGNELDEGYYKIDGKPLKEKNPKWLQDDYVKFIRFSQWKIDQAGEGVLGFVTNHSYLDNPTFRGMRRSLMRSFDEIYLLDLHGNSLKKEKCPDGSLDQNVFDIRQGVAIALFIKKKDKSKRQPLVFHADLWGLRKEKYDWLSMNDVKKTKWKKISPKSEGYPYQPVDERLLSHYARYMKIDAVFPVGNVGIVTARDKLTIQWTPEEAWLTVLNFSKMDEDIARKGYGLGNDVKDWKVRLAQKDLLDSGPDRKNIAPILYRPFDTRHTYYTGRSRGFICRPRPEVMQHMLQGNVALIVPKQFKETPGAFVAESIVAHKTVSAFDINYVFPLYLYAEKTKAKNRNPRNFILLFEPEADYLGKRPNLSSQILKLLEAHLRKKLSPEQIFHYIYAVLYSNRYRDKYAEFLKRDFPRIPFARNYRIFENLSELGERLVELHLMKSPELDHPLAKFRGKGKNKVANPAFEKDASRVFINPEQFFEEVPADVWGYRIGGYQVCHKWLKDRKGRTLPLEEIKHYCKIVTAISKTMEIQTTINEIYPEIEKDTIAFREG
ncbi:MAG: N-6 DNA methylase [Deltaproteobacteria bacterium]|nr:N-6 DNA methylase [Deltaproteobacteria bacterium]